MLDALFRCDGAFADQQRIVRFADRQPNLREHPGAINRTPAAGLGFAQTARTVNVPVFGLIWLSMKSMVPWCAWLASLASFSSTG